ncbi:hypothetical protein [Sulfitobacter mediterraneus]|uniref:hypothetical protein n=1 Tax=Sulfitobacter mediterraneus TaxID=83219 RepID=UPI00193A06E2|nr:hypothetical protein [Sulfitobacter mediterraneus]MBM1576105.1 hypothetical protein [Sulfitobacter mediterraneus]MBM1595197.1 hypothetical protein [Sulfitobacter mediterraneus]
MADTLICPLLPLETVVLFNEFIFCAPQDQGRQSVKSTFARSQMRVLPVFCAITSGLGRFDFTFMRPERDFGTPLLPDADSPSVLRRLTA